ncbi:MAG: tRNA (adenosine(37)-N6)-threonylcarbamoyltransferase complex dimerization subunit type 1 TsaB [Planctomycetes bacterium]|nr:tRNA (adenosine(37)-N6)-threonylcarbamoyltransferase complex dimerization subunit type 1 TsaB [Planctomycetota bacterium]
MSHTALLAFELSSHHSSVAVARQTAANEDESEVIAGHHYRFHQRSTAGQRARYLLQEVDQLLTDAQLPRLAIGGIIAGIGPGSYTGLRIACSAAHTLGFALNVPFAGICSFEAAALLADANGKSVHILQDAYRKEAYYAVARVHGHDVIIEREPEVVAMQSIPEQATHPNSYLICDERLSGKLARPENALLAPTASGLLKIAFGRGATVTGAGFEALANAEPMYLRAAAFRPGK